MKLEIQVQAEKCDRVKPVMESQPFPLDRGISPELKKWESLKSHLAFISWSLTMCITLISFA
jgi:hypothetical protein